MFGVDQGTIVLTSSESIIDVARVKWEDLRNAQSVAIVTRSRILGNKVKVDYSTHPLPQGALANIQSFQAWVTQLEEKQQNDTHWHAIALS